ncbi:MAG TPA: lipid-binding SYLF domain-containing protein [Vicinamibacterales bacterium]|jgi:lipid-binding SYLF domain-containing protein|nr:lipid-binding SYLF domain-containing protein [Vicinamibacterales bacterium]
MARSALAFDRGAALAASAVLTVLAVSRIGTARAGEVDWLTPSAKIVEHARREIPPDTWERARCVAVMPAASAGDGAGGRGVMSCRSGERWSAPLFLRLTNGSAAFQAGPGRADLVLLLMNESSVGNILGRRVSLGSGTGVLAYSSSNGAFAGVYVSSGVLRPDEDANTIVYGRGSSPRTILAAREISAPIEAAPFLRALGRSANTSAAPDATPGSTHGDVADRPNATRAVDDDDLRARLLVAEQTIDRMLTDTAAPAGGVVMAAAAEGGRATGANGATVSVERARLIQLRQQLDAVLAKLGRR